MLRGHYHFLIVMQITEMRFPYKAAYSPKRKGKQVHNNEILNSHLRILAW